MTDITIPPEALEAVARSMCDWDGVDCDEVQTAAYGTTYVMWQAYIPKARAACFAMLQNWPKMIHDKSNWAGSPILFLPLTESGNE